MNIDFRFYISLFFRRLPVMLTLTLICAGLGIAAAYNAPPTYLSSTRVLIEEAQIDIGTRSRTVITPDQQLQLIRERILTRANLIDIANKFEVFEDMRTRTPDSIFAEMATSTQIRVNSGRNEVTLMSISFEARTGQIAANVVSEYLTLVQDDSSSATNNQAESTVEFFQREVDRLSADLDRQSAQILEFKERNADALPDDLAFRYERQGQLQDRLTSIERERVDIESQRADVIRLFQATGRVNDLNATQMSPAEMRLAELEFELRNTRAVLSDTNPKVVLLQNQVDQLRATVAEATPDEVEDELGTSGGSLLEIRLAEYETRLASLVSEREATITAMEAIDRSIASTAANAIALAGFERDFDNIQDRYNSASTKLEEARLALELQTSEQGQRLSIIESPNIPQDPSGPNRLRIAAMGVGAGLALAAGFFALLELTNRTIRRPVEIESRFNVTPIASIPYMESRRQKLVRRGLLALALLVVLVGVPLVLLYVDQNYMPLDIIVAKITNRLGL